MSIYSETEEGRKSLEVETQIYFDMKNNNNRITDPEIIEGRVRLIRFMACQPKDKLTRDGACRLDEETGHLTFAPLGWAMYLDGVPIEKLENLISPAWDLDSDVCWRFKINRNEAVLIEKELDEQIEEFGFDHIKTDVFAEDIAWVLFQSVPRSLLPSDLNSNGVPESRMI